MFRSIFLSTPSILIGVRSFNQPENDLIKEYSSNITLTLKQAPEKTYQFNDEPPKTSEMIVYTADVQKENIEFGLLNRGQPYLFDLHPPMPIYQNQSLKNNQLIVYNTDEQCPNPLIFKDINKTDANPLITENEFKSDENYQPYKPHSYMEGEKYSVPPIKERLGLVDRILIDVNYYLNVFGLTIPNIKSYFYHTTNVNGYEVNTILLLCCYFILAILFLYIIGSVFFSNESFTKAEVHISNNYIKRPTRLQKELLLDENSEVFDDIITKQQSYPKSALKYFM